MLDVTGGHHAMLRVPCLLIPPPPTCPPSPSSGPALSTCLSGNQPIRAQNEDTEEVGQTDSGSAPSRGQLRPAAFGRQSSVTDGLQFPQCTAESQRRLQENSLKMDDSKTASRGQTTFSAP